MATKTGRTSRQTQAQARTSRKPAVVKQAVKTRDPQEEPRPLELKRAEESLWWLGLLQGVAAIFFGIVAIFWPGLTLATLVYLFSAFILAWGIVEVINGLLSVRRRDTWWLTLVFGVAGLSVGTYLVRHPGVSFTALILILGLVLIGRGLLDLMAAFIEPRGSSRRALMLIIGVVALIAGIILLFQPEAGGVAFVWILGLYALVFGSLITALAIETRHETHEMHGQGG